MPHGQVPYSEFRPGMLQIGDELGFACEFDETNPFDVNDLPYFERFRAKLFHREQKKRYRFGSDNSEILHEFSFTNSAKSVRLGVAAYERSNQVFLVVLKGAADLESMDQWRVSLHNNFPALRVVKKSESLRPLD